jgi:hypothetical protein
MHGKPPHTVPRFNMLYRQIHHTLITPTERTQLKEIIDTLINYGRDIKSTILVTQGSVSTDEIKGRDNLAAYQFITTCSLAIS